MPKAARSTCNVIAKQLKLTKDLLNQLAKVLGSTLKMLHGIDSTTALELRFITPIVLFPIGIIRISNYIDYRDGLDDVKVERYSSSEFLHRIDLDA